MARGLRVLLDGEWHPEELILTEMAKSILPATAIRRAEQRRRNQRAAAKARVQSDSRQVERSTETLWTLGSRHIAQDSLRANKRVEYRIDERNVRWVRLRPREIEVVRQLLS